MRSVTASFLHFLPRSRGLLVEVDPRPRHVDGVGRGWVGKFHFIGPRNRCGIQSAAAAAAKLMK